MLTSPFVRRSLLIFGGFGVICLIVLTLVGLSVPATAEGISTLRWRLLSAEVVLLILGLFLLVQLTHSWILQVIDLTRATRQLGGGHSPERLPVDDEQELGRLIESFNEMVHLVEARRVQLVKNQQRVTSDNEQLATVLEAMVEGVIAIDQDEQILLANLAAIRLLDLKAFNVVGRRMWETIRIPQIHDLVRATLAGGTEARLEVDVPWTYSTVAVVASRLPGDPSPGAVLVLHDVTELRRLENLRREFVSNVSHELKTPLASIAAYAETLLNGALDDPDVSRTFIGRISEQSERLSSLIMDLLELARIESGEHVFQVDAIDVIPILRLGVDDHQAIAQSKQLKLTIDCAEPSLIAMVDPEGLRTIVDNLIGNGINYTRPGGSITVRSYSNNGDVILEVQDTGVGIAKEFQSRIFERFFRVDRARSREMGGTGLGLSIVKHLCNVFGGSVKVSSQVGQGSTFTVQLKAAPVASVSALT